MQNNENKFTSMKLWLHTTRKIIKSRNITKTPSNYCNDDNLNQLSDNESDKTVTESINKKHFFDRGRRSNKNNNSCCYNKNKSYDKRDSSLDIIRNEKDDYEIVMQYQRYSNKRRINIFDKKEIDKEILMANKSLQIK